MRRFAALFDALDTTTSTNAKVDALIAYFASVPADDAAWATYVLIGRRLARSVGPASLRRWLNDEARLPDWLVEEAYASVGDLAETIALLVPPRDTTNKTDSNVPLTEWFTARLLPLRLRSETEQRACVVGWWRALPYRQRFLVNKLLTGSLRVGVSRSLVTRALAMLLGRPRVDIEQALIGDWTPGTAFWEALVRGDASADITQPFPFFLASLLTDDIEKLGARDDWLVEWKWDGIRGQIVRRGDQCALWSRGEEIIGARFPEIINAARALPAGTVLDGEVLAWRDERVMPFASLQKRIGRKSVGAKILADVPARFLAFDLLEFNGEDWRARPLRERREKLHVLAGVNSAIGISAALEGPSWIAIDALRRQSRAQGVEGVMLKQWSSPYGAGRQRGAWWKWKIEPFVFDAVLIYAAPGHGRRSNLYTDYTFAVWQDQDLVPVAKAYSGLTDAELGELDRWIRANTREKFGPVRSVEPVQVFELAYENIAASSRHKSGIAVRFPRMLRWRKDKLAADADSLSNLQLVLEQQTRAD